MMPKYFGSIHHFIQSLKCEFYIGEYLKFDQKLSFKNGKIAL